MYWQVNIYKIVINCCLTTDCVHLIFKSNFYLPANTFLYHEINKFIHPEINKNCDYLVRDTYNWHLWLIYLMACRSIINETQTWGPFPIFFSSRLAPIHIDIRSFQLSLCTPWHFTFMNYTIIYKYCKRNLTQIQHPHDYNPLTWNQFFLRTC